MPEPASRLRAMLTSRSVPLLATAVFLVLLACYLSAPQAYHTLMDWSGAPPVYLNPEGPGHWDQPFFDTRFVLGLLKCWRQGIDVYIVNPCDPIGRLQDYSPIWLRFGFIPTTNTAVVAIGLAFDVLFLGSLFLLPAPAPHIADNAAFALATVSAATVFAMERGNTDLLIFAMCVVAAHLLSRSLPSRAAGYGMILAAAALKFFPIVLLCVAIRERIRSFLAVTIASAGAVLLYVHWFGAETGRALANTASGYFVNMWGAASLPFGIAQLVHLASQGQGASSLALHERMSDTIPWLATGLFVIIAAGLALRIATNADFTRAFVTLPTRSRMFLMTGATLTAGCFVAHQNIGYRAILVVIEMPGLLAMARNAETPPFRLLLGADVLVTVFLAWSSATWLLPTGGWERPAMWLLRNSLWWGHVTICLAVMWRFGLESELAEKLGLRRALGAPAIQGRQSTI